MPVNVWYKAFKVEGAIIDWCWKEHLWLEVARKFGRRSSFECRQNSISCFLFPAFFLALSGFLLAYNLKEREKNDEMCSLSTEIRPTTTSNDKLQSWWLKFSESCLRVSHDDFFFFAIPYMYTWPFNPMILTAESFYIFRSCSRKL